MFDGNIYGCMDSEAMNYDMYANIDDESCYYVVTQDITIIPGFLNNISLNIDLEDMSPEMIFENSDILIASNDQGDYFMPSLGVNSMGQMNNSDGYLVYFNGSENQTISLTGMPASMETVISLEPYSINYIGYTPQYAISVEDAFLDIPVFIVSDQFGNYYFPELGINSIDESGGMQPGRGYMVYQGDETTIDFTYPEGLGKTINENISAIESRKSLQYDIVETGNPYPILITEIFGDVQIGDEIVAFSDGNVVGATRIINKDEVIVLTAWGNLDQYNIESVGFIAGDNIELKLWKSMGNSELPINEMLDYLKYGESVFSMGKIEIIESLDLPDQFSLDQNFPNPFNPNTLISFTLNENVNKIELNLFDIKGNFIVSLVSGSMNAGNHSVEWNALDENDVMVPAGIYFYSLQSDNTIITRKMVLIK
jgi:hypothetical protein